MKLRTRLLLGIGGIVVGLGLVIAGMAFLLDRTLGRYDSLFRNEKQLATDAMDAYIFMLQARRHEKDFVIRLKPEYVEKHAAVLKQLQEMLGKMRNASTLDEILPSEIESKDAKTVRALLDDLDPGVQAYASAFTALVDAERKRGLNQDEGAQKTFREAAHSLEKQIPAENQGLLVRLLQVRRAEKDYLLRLRTEGEKYRAKTLAELDQLQTAMAAIPDAKTAIAAYRDGFLALVACDQDIAKAENALREAIHRVETDIDRLHDSAEIFADRQSAATVDFAARWRIIALLVAGCGILAAFAIVAIQASVLARPIVATAEVLRRVAEGDFRDRMHSTRQDEIGDMARALDATLASLRQAISAIATEAAKVAKESQGIETVSAHVAQAAETNAKESQVVASATEEVSASSTTVAASAEEMLAAIAEISRNVQEVTGIARDADGKSGAAQSEMEALSKASTEIGSVVQLIRGIAEQTNLLALNATIEAARAGDAGRGFAVVASEVKTLAGQTAEATVRIEQMVNGIQGRANGALAAITEIAQVVRRIAEIQASIASAVEEQSATSQEITRAVGEVSVGVKDINQAITGVSRAATETSQTSTEARAAATNLLAVSQELDGVVGRFRT